MSVDMQARAATTALVRETIERFGPMPARWLEETLDETPQAIGRALSRLLIQRRVGLVRTPGCLVVQYAAREG